MSNHKPKSARSSIFTPQAMAAAASVAQRLYGHYMGPRASRNVVRVPKYQTRRPPNLTLDTNRRMKYGQGMMRNRTSHGPNVRFGKSSKLSKSFINKVREAVASTNTEQIQLASSNSSAVGKCAYFMPGNGQQLFAPTDMQTILGHLPTGNVTSKFTVKNAEMSFQISNAHQSACYVRAYLCQARADVPTGAGLTTPLLYLTQGFTDAIETSNATNYASTVFSSPTFCTWFKVLNVKNITLQPGENKYFTIKDRSPHLINMERWAPGAINNIISKQRLSKFYIFQIWGSIINDSTNKTYVSIDASKVNCVGSTRYEYVWTDDYTNNIFQDGTVLGTISTAEIINPDTDAILTGPADA